MNRKKVWGVAGILAFGLLCCSPGCLGKKSVAQLPKGAASPSAAKKAKAAEPTKTLLKVMA